MTIRAVPIRWVLFDWGDTLMYETGGPAELPMALWPEVRAIDGAAELLARLGPRHRIGIATNASVSDRGMIERALARVLLAPFVSEVFCYRELGVRKSEAAFWDAVVARTGVGRDEIAMIGDDLEQDVVAPRRSGIASMWFNWKRAEAETSAGAGFPVIYHLADVPEVLAGMSSGSGQARGQK